MSGSIVIKWNLNEARLNGLKDWMNEKIEWMTRWSKANLNFLMKWKGIKITIRIAIGLKVRLSSTFAIIWLCWIEMCFVTKSMSLIVFRCLFRFVHLILSLIIKLINWVLNLFMSLIISNSLKLCNQITWWIANVDQTKFFCFPFKNNVVYL